MDKIFCLINVSPPKIHGDSWRVCVLSHFSRVRVFATLWAAAHQAPLSVACSTQEYWSGLPCLPPGDLPDPGIEPISIMSPALAGMFFTTSSSGEALIYGRNHRLKINTFKKKVHSSLIIENKILLLGCHFFRFTGISLY